MKILILPCAGGTSFNYREFELKSEDVLVYEYPGHWSRIEENFENSLEEMASNLVEWYLSRNIDKELVILGHSMGAIVGYESIKYFSQRKIDVKILCVAACGSPNKMTSIVEDAIRSESNLIGFLKSIRRNIESVIESDFFQDNLLPSIKNDFQLLHKYGKKKKAKILPRKIDALIVGLYGKADSFVDSDGIYEWEMYTSKGISFYEMNGDHFFINKNVDRVLQIIYEESSLQ